MECGVVDLGCLFQSNQQTIIQSFGFLLDKIAGPVLESFREHIQAIIALAGFAFGITRWWRHREKILHNRLTKYLNESDKRLDQGQSYILTALNRPRPGMLGELPLFASPKLRRVFKRHNWDGTVFATGVEESVSQQLDQAKDWVQDRLISAEEATDTLKRQMATLHVLQGALAAGNRDEQMQALSSFRAVTQIPGQEGNLIAKELEAHTLRKLGRFDEALAAYSEMETMAVSGAMDRTHWLAVAQAKRYQAEMTQALAASVDTSGVVVFKATNAVNFVSPRIAGSALDIRKRYAPFEDWEQIDQADLHYLTAFLANVCQFNQIEPRQLHKARQAYESVLHGTSRRRYPIRMGRLFREARAGLDRVRAAEQGQYDTRWLFPALDHPQH